MFLNLFTIFAHKRLHFLTMKNYLLLIFAILTIVACSKDDDGDRYAGPEPNWRNLPERPHDTFERTVLVYISGENNLSHYIPSEIQELRQGSKGIGNNALVVYVDEANERRNPYILWIRDGVTVDSTALDNDPLSSSAETMLRVLNFTSTYYPANEYGLVLWGHASGWMIEDSAEGNTAGSRPFRAYGIDNGNNSSSTIGKWMNISTIAQTLERWRHHLKFIFADCCQFQCIETAYELLGLADYIIASPAEIPGKGAPYDTITPGFFEQSTTFYKTIVDRYFDQIIEWNSDWEGTYSSRTPLSVVYCPELLNLATATNEVLSTFLPLENNALPSLSDLIYYRGNTRKRMEDVMYDMNDFIRKYTIGKNNSTATDSAAYDKWRETFNRAIIYSTNATEGWSTSGQVSTTVFSYLSQPNRYGGISMFVPQNRTNTWYLPYTLYGVDYNGYNEDIKTTAWYAAAHLDEFGW